MALRPEMIHLIRLDIVDDIIDLLCVRKISVMQEKAGVGRVRVDIYLIDPSGIKCACPADDAVHLVAPGKQEFRKVRTVLPGYAGDQSFFHEV
jgi:hypothetical protein